MTEIQPALDPDIELRHLEAQERTCAGLVQRAAKQIVIDSAHKRMVPGSGRKLIAEAVILCEVQAALSKARKAAAKAAAQARVAA